MQLNTVFLSLIGKLCEMVLLLSLRIHLFLSVRIHTNLNILLNASICRFTSCIVELWQMSLREI